MTKVHVENSLTHGGTIWMGAEVVMGFTPLSSMTRQYPLNYVSVPRNAKFDFSEVIHDPQRIYPPTLFVNIYLNF